LRDAATISGVLALSTSVTKTEQPELGLPSVSIITVCYNSVATIRDTIESVLSQDHARIEYIIIDGGSTDGTCEVVRSYGSRIDFFESKRDRGIYDAMNKGLAWAHGDVIGMLNSDDVYSDSHAVTALMEALVEARADAVFADVVYVHHSNLSRVVRYYNSGYWRPARFRFGLMPAHPTFFVKRDVYARVGEFSPDFRIAADFEMLVRILYRVRASYVHVPRPVVKMRLGGVSTRSLRQSWLINREIVRACCVNGLWTALPVVLLKIPLKLLEFVRRPG
jgi:glycosyltransferase involved in cell wall biosynthesis